MTRIITASKSRPRQWLDNVTAAAGIVVLGLMPDSLARRLVCRERPGEFTGI